MRRLPGYAGAALAACAAVVALVAVGPAAAASSSVQVKILDSGFQPRVVTVKQWQVVDWTNDGKTKHGVASDTGSTLRSAALDPGQAYGNLFTKAGTFSYHDPVHPSLTGRVIVVASPKPKVTGPNPPSGKRPKGFHPQATITSASGPSNGSGGGGGTDWTAIGGGLGGAAIVLVGVAAFLLLRRRRPAG